MPSLPANIITHPGPPPHPGWWATSWVHPTHNGITTRSGWRFHDGQHWSVPVPTTATPEDVDYLAGLSSPPYYAKTLRWYTFWPAHARVPRVNPATGEVTGGQA